MPPFWIPFFQMSSASYDNLNVLENATHRILQDFEIPTDHQILARRTDLVRINPPPKKKTKKRGEPVCRIVDSPSRQTPEWKSKTKTGSIYLDLGRELKELSWIRVTVMPFVVGAFGKVPKGLVRRLKGLKIGERAETSQTKNVKIDQNTEKCPGNLRRFAVTQIPLKDHHLTLVWKTRKIFNTSK